MEITARKLTRAAVFACAAAVLTACSSIIDGTTQELFISTSPADADCAIEREGTTIGRVNPTPGAALVEKTKHDIVVRCVKDGFHTSTYYNKSDVAGATFGNIILGGGIGWAIDSASGADNKYTSPLNITLVPLSQPAPEPEYSPEEEAEDQVEGDQSTPVS